MNRVGEENGFPFIGRSRICNVNGNLLAAAGDSEEVILMAEIDVQQARNKHIIRVPGLHEIHRFADRRPNSTARCSSPSPRFIHAAMSPVLDRSSA